MRAAKSYILVFFITLLTGIGLHYLYDLIPSPLTAVLCVVRESLWEHLKLLFWPYLISSLFLSRFRKTPLLPRLFSLLLLCAVLLGISFWYHILLGGESVAVDVGLYLLMMSSGFSLPFFLPDLPSQRYGFPLVFLTAALAFLLILFTFSPPDQLLFWDLSHAHTWHSLPC